MRRVHVDRAPELDLFNDVVNGIGTANVVLIQAEQGMGKSSLLAKFYEACPSSVRAFVDLKPGTHTVPGLLGELATQLGPSRFERFLADDPTVKLQFMENRMNKSSINIDSINIDSSAAVVPTEELNLRRISLTNTFFDDLHRSNGAGEAIVVILDAFNNATPEVKGWLQSPFFNFARQYRWLVVVVAGTSVPEPGVGSDSWCIERTLLPLDPGHLTEWVREVQLPLLDSDIRMLYELSGGIPSYVSAFVGTLVKKRGVEHAS